MPVTFFVIQTHREVLCRVRQYWLTYEVFCIKLRRNIRQCWLIAHSSEKFHSENILLVYARLGIFSKLLLSKVDSRLDELDECWQRRRLVRKWTYWGATVCKYCYQKPIAIEAEFAKDCGWLPWWQSRKWLSIFDHVNGLLCIYNGQNCKDFRVRYCCLWRYWIRKPTRPGI